MDDNPLSTQWHLTPATAPWSLGRRLGRGTLAWPTRVFAILFIGLLLVAPSFAETAPTRLEYNRDIRPILAEACFHCHGMDPQQRKGKLRLDVREAALEKQAISPGKPEASTLIERIFSTDPDEVMPPPKDQHQLTVAQRETLRQWIAQGAEYERHWAFIPPEEVPLPSQESLNQGAFTPEATQPPPLEPIDAFVLDSLQKRGLSPAPPADRETWLRRVSFALTGLPPSPQEQADYLGDASAEARQRVVDRLLASPAYGEHVSQDWLDAARYADSYGRHEDGDMVVWPWRDWVIAAFNDNLPYNQFVLEQLAGDLLPDATQQQRVATAFNRLAQQSNESGSDPLEFRLDQVSDRVRASGLAFMGLTMECAKCHDHKYDPITQKEYWQMAAFFDNLPENGVYSQFCPQAVPSPSLLLPDAAQKQKLATLRSQITQLEAKAEKVRSQSRSTYAEWRQDHLLPGEPQKGLINGLKGVFGKGQSEPWNHRALAHYDLVDIKKTADKTSYYENQADSQHPAKPRIKLETMDAPAVAGLDKVARIFKADDEIAFPELGDYHQYDAFSFALWLRPQESRERAVVLARSRAGLDDGRGYEVLLEKEVPSFALSHFQPGNEIRIRARDPLPLNEWTHLAVTYDGSSRASGLRLYLNGSLVDTEIIHDHLEKDITRKAEHGDTDTDGVRLTVGGREHDMPLKNCGVDEFWMFDRAISAGEVKRLAAPTTPPDEALWQEWWLAEHHAPWQQIQQSLHGLRQQYTAIADDILEMMVMQELPVRRPSYVRLRGDYRQPAEEVQPDTPAEVLPFPADLPRNRLGFAQWLISPQHPLTARVEVNRIWQMFYGQGLVSTPQDFGTRGAPPTHPELFDWLTTDFVKHGWDVKRLCRQIALSHTFAQSSIPQQSDTLTHDPENEWLARGPRVRLTAEEIRDTALAASSLLSTKIGGASAHPYMPPFLYQESGLQQSYQPDQDDGAYRRSLYSFWRRTLPPPELAAFDAPSREFCVVKRDQTNTPLQALVLLNSPQFVECQRVLAERVLKAADASDDPTRCTLAFQLLANRAPAEAELQVMQRLLQQERAYFHDHIDEAQALATLHTSPATIHDDTLSPTELAATTTLMRILMSHDLCLYR